MDIINSILLYKNSNKIYIRIVLENNTYYVKMAGNKLNFSDEHVSSSLEKCEMKLTQIIEYYTGIGYTMDLTYINGLIQKIDILNLPECIKELIKN